MRANLRYIDLASAHDENNHLLWMPSDFPLTITFDNGYAVMAAACGHSTKATTLELDRAHNYRRYPRNIMCNSNSNSNRCLLWKYIVPNKHSIEWGRRKKREREKKNAEKSERMGYTSIGLSTLFNAMKIHMWSHCSCLVAVAVAVSALMSCVSLDKKYGQQLCSHEKGKLGITKNNERTSSSKLNQTLN